MLKCLVISKVQTWSCATKWNTKKVNDVKNEKKGERVCLKRTQLPRVIFTFNSLAHPTSWCPPGIANWGYGNLASMFSRKKISTSLLVIIILVHNKWCMLFVQLREDVSVKNTQFPGLPTSLCYKGHPIIKLSASVKSCKM